MVERNTGCIYTGLCNFSRLHTAHILELCDIRAPWLGVRSLDRARPWLPWATCTTQSLVYFLSKCWGHSVLRRTVCLHKHSCQCSLSVCHSRLSWKVLHLWGRLLFFECRPYSPAVHLSSDSIADLQAPLPCSLAQPCNLASAAVNWKGRRRSQAGGGSCWSRLAVIARDPVTSIWESGAFFRCLWEI